jgi:hypothetical protein
MNLLLSQTAIRPKAPHDPRGQLPSKGLKFITDTAVTMSEYDEQINYLISELERIRRKAKVNLARAIR